MLQSFPVFIIEDIQRINKLWLYFGIVAFLIFAAVFFSVIFFAKKYKAKSQDETPQQSHGNRKFEVGMTLLSTTIIVVFFFLTINTMNAIQNIPDHPIPDLVITGHQWWWEAKYKPDGLVVANEIHIPIGKKLMVKFTSADVIHSWYVPKLGRKMDLIPGRDNYMRIYADKPGEYLGSCNEFCGAEHAWMRIRVVAQTPEDFKKWKLHQLQPAISSRDSLSMRGKSLFEKKTCVNCHTIRGVNSNEDIGPDLTHFASRKYFLSNSLLNNHSNLKDWLKYPKKVKPGANMPDFIFTKEERKALQTYLTSLK